MTFQPEEPAGDQDDAPLVIREDMLAAEEAPAARIDFEQEMPYLPRVTIYLILANVAVFVWAVAGGALANAEALIEAGALQQQRVMQGEVWRLLSAIFLHASGRHLLFNCIVLFIVGMALEHAFGWKRSALIYLAAGLCGSLLSVSLHPGPSVGASGAIFGVTGCVIVFFYKYHRQVMLRDKRIGFVLLIWALYEIGSGMASPFVDNYAHVGGFLGGALVGLVLRPTLLSKPQSADDSGFAF
jgi:rhomboid protease GluP